jgi:hypothetical protein
MDINLKNNFMSCVTGQSVASELFAPMLSSKKFESCVMLQTGKLDKGLQRVDCERKSSLACQVFYIILN